MGLHTVCLKLQLSALHIIKKNNSKKPATNQPASKANTHIHSEAIHTFVHKQSTKKMAKQINGNILNG